MIVNGLGDIFGFGIWIFIMILVTFFLFLFSRGAGMTALIVTFFLSVFLFATNKISGVFVINSGWLVTVAILAGLLIGFMIYQLFFEG